MDKLKKDIQARNTLRVALYIRVSSKEQVEGYSIGEQEERLKKYAEAMGWEIYKIYIDPGYSGGSTNRPGLQTMLDDVKAGKVDKVVVYKLDRLSRSQKDTLTLIEDDFLAYDVDFVSMSENFDTSTPFGRAMIGILAVFAQLEREQIRERMEMGREARIKKGYYHGSNRNAIGYDYIDGDLIINEYESMIVKEIFSLYNSGVSIHKISDILNERGLNHRYGLWIPQTIKRLMQNRTYLGEVRYKGDNWYPGLHTAIIDKKTFDIANARMEKNRENFFKNNESFGKHTSILGGLIVCSHCGGKYGKCTSGKLKDGSRYSYYTCYSKSKKMKSRIMDPNCKNKTYRMEELDEIIFSEIRKLKTDPDYIYEIRSEKPVVELKEDPRILIEQEISELKETISNYMDLYALKKVLTLDQVDEKISPLTERVNKLEIELDSLEIDEDDALTEKETIEILDSFEEILDRGNFEEIRLTVTSLINSIDIDNEDITIHWNFA